MNNFYGDPQKKSFITRGAIRKPEPLGRKLFGASNTRRSGGSADIPLRAIRMDREYRPARNSSGVSVKDTRPSSISSAQSKPLASSHNVRSRGGQRPTVPYSSPHLSSSETNSAQTSQPQQILVQGMRYTVRKHIGDGGTSVVYKVCDEEGKEYALKKVALNTSHPNVVSAMRGEIEHLQHLSSESRVVDLISFEVCETDLKLVMELGEMDLRKLLRNNVYGLSMTFVRYWATEILQCVKTVHSHDIVHSDLKPENFLVVQGHLKIIDFGIANVVPDYTVNVHRDVKVGTVSYMAPESVCEQTSFHGKDFKVGKPADMWSCGCIIYEMVYGSTPLKQYGRQQLAALESQSLQISFPARVKNKRIPKGLLELLQGCLYREPQKRLTVDEALQGLFLTPRSVDYEFVQDLIIKSVEFGQNYDRPVTNERMYSLIHGVWNKIIELNDVEVEDDEPKTPKSSSLSSTPVATPISRRGFP